MKCLKDWKFICFLLSQCTKKKRKFYHIYIYHVTYQTRPAGRCLSELYVAEISNDTSSKFLYDSFINASGSKNGHYEPQVTGELDNKTKEQILFHKHGRNDNALDKGQNLSAKNMS